MITANFKNIYTYYLETNNISLIDVNLSEFLADNELRSYETPTDFLDTLQEEGPDVNLNFFGNKLIPAEIIELINSENFGFIVFKKNGSDTVPYLLERKDKAIIELNLKLNTVKEIEFSKFNENDYCFEFEDLNAITCIVNESNYVSLLNTEPDAKPFKKLVSFLRLERKDIYNLLLYTLIGGIVGLTVPLGIQSLINFLQTGQVTASGIVLIILIIFGVLSSGVIQIIQLWIMEIIQQRLFARTAFDFINRIPQLSHKVLSKYYPPELMNRFFDIVSLQKGLSGLLIDITSSLVQILFGLLILCFYHPVFIAFTVFIIAIVMLILKLTFEKGLSSSLKESKFKYQTANWLQQVARARESFRMYTQGSFELNKMDSLVSSYILARKKHFKVLVTQYIAFIAFSVLITGGLLIVGYILLMSETISLGQFVASEVIILLIVNSIEKLILKLESVYDILTSVEKIAQVATLPIDNTRNQLRINYKLPITVQINGLEIHSSIYSFSLNAEHPSQMIKLQSRNQIDAFIDYFYKVKPERKGEILINNINVSKINKYTLNANTGIFSDRELLFDGSIKENITIGNSKIKDEHIVNFFNNIGANTFINSQPEGLNTEVLGGLYSAKQEFYRLLILARTLLKEPRLLVIDDYLLPEIINSQKLINYVKTNLPNSLIIIVKTNTHEI
jgi:ABC-type bacteriocin/lantibiotic exporter with double-glycine peptidase domain